MIRMQFTGNQTGSVSYGGRNITPSGRLYKGGNNAFSRFIEASPEDVEWLERLGVWKKVQSAPRVPPIPTKDEEVMAAAPEILPQPVPEREPEKPVKVKQESIPVQPRLPNVDVRREPATLPVSPDTLYGKPRKKNR